MAYVAGSKFSHVGVGIFWPVMFGAVAQRVPLVGALGVNVQLIGGIGMFSPLFFQPK